MARLPEDGEGGPVPAGGEVCPPRQQKRSSSVQRASSHTAGDEGPRSGLQAGGASSGEPQEERFHQRGRKPRPGLRASGLASQHTGHSSWRRSPRAARAAGASGGLRVEPARGAGGERRGSVRGLRPGSRHMPAGSAETPGTCSLPDFCVRLFPQGDRDLEITEVPRFACSHFLLSHRLPPSRPSSCGLS